MAGLLDGIDPQTALLLGLGSGLLGTSGNGRRASFGEALANGMQQGTAGYRQAIGDRQRAEQLAAEQIMRQQQMRLQQEESARAQGRYGMDQQAFSDQRAEAQRKQQQSEQMRDLARRFALNTGPTLESGPEPVAGGFDRQGYAQALEAVDPVAGLQYQSMIAKGDEGENLPEGAIRVNRRTGAVIARNPKAATPTDAAKKYEELSKMMPWLTHEQKVQLAYDTITTVTPHDGGVATVSRMAQLGALQPGGQRPAMPQGGMAPQPAPGAMPSPYQPSPPAPGQIGGNPGSKPTERLNTDVKGFAGELEKANIPQLEQALTTVEGLLSKIPKGGDVPGYGMTGMMPNWLLSDEGKTIRMALAPLANLTLKDRSGAAVTNPEMARFLNELGTGAMMSDADMMRGVTTLRSMLNATKSNFMAGAHPEVIAEYNKRYGTNTQMPLGASAGPGAQPAQTAQATPQTRPAAGAKVATAADITATLRANPSVSRAELIRRLEAQGYTINDPMYRAPRSGASGDY